MRPLVLSTRLSSSVLASLLLSVASLLALTACGQEGRLPGGEGGSGGETSTTGAPSSASSGGGGAGAVDPLPLTLLNWNTHNFFNDKKDDPKGFDSDYPELLSTSEYIAKRQSVAAVIHELNPDIAVLQEIENQAVLDDLRANLKALGNEYVHAALVPSIDLREIAILSKVEIGSVVSHQDEWFEVWGTQSPSYRYTRDCLEVHVTWNTRPLVLLGVHFRSKFGEDDPQKRLAEAQRTRDIANALGAANPSTAVVILGDFNDTPGSPPVTSVVGEGPTAFLNAASLALPASDAWSYSYKGELELIDHQMANPVLAGMLDKTSVKISHVPAFKDASDHAPVLATYNVQ